MSDRKAELERKKQKLEMMRKERQEKERLKKSNPGAEPEPKTKGSSQVQSADDLLRDLGIPTQDESAVERALSDKGADSTEGSLEHTPQPTPTKVSKVKGVRLSVARVSETNIPPKENVTYCKETQTQNVEPLDRDGLGLLRNYDDQEPDTDSVDVSLGAPQPHHHPKMPHVEMVAPAHTLEDESQPGHLFRQAVQRTWSRHQGKSLLSAPIREMSEDEKNTIQLSEEFRYFLDHSARIVERALDEVQVDFDYSRTGDDDLANKDLAGERLKLNREFFDERWSKHRIVTSMDWSTQFPELLVASYGAYEDAPHDPDGVALIWNSRFKKSTPEYVFHCQSAVMSSCFAKFHPNLVVGGTYSGQIVLWDNRVLKRTPIQRTPLSASAHTHPVYCVNVVGTQNAHNLISVSTDGKMCSWSLDMLSQPQDCMELQYTQTKAVNVTCFSFMSGDVNNFVVGSEDCTVYAACRHGSKAGISESFEGHQGPVTGIDCHKVAGQIDFSPYFVTSSFDWTIKLWSMKDRKYIHSFEDNSDYVYDVQWSPIHPALFASADGMGRLDLWNLNQDTEVPSASSILDTGAALNHLRWHQNGHMIAAGDDMGHIYLHDVAESFANPKSDEWSRFVHTLQELKQHAAEREEDTTLAGLSSPIR
ncbi:cytoplasmic dynein 1 intermediate chain 2-like isoform X2 [Dreissena polymorpha]|uniref:cytoplasmic dynein 1 intermediate chain 2-like isoform X2 n=1 Tax=Dreissena polymorpha TaxID=45954 RepID=UPI002263B04C|nr:cytoplasmic dynein 1 intermediate chain 2-like isoform X2 [Dreissena polymorpha]